MHTGGRNTQSARSFGARNIQIIQFLSNKLSDMWVGMDPLLKIGASVFHLLKISFLVKLAFFYVLRYYQINKIHKLFWIIKIKDFSLKVAVLRFKLKFIRIKLINIRLKRIIVSLNLKLISLNLIIISIKLNYISIKRICYRFNLLCRY